MQALQKQITSTRDILSYLEKSLESSILKQVQNIEHMLQTQMESEVLPEERGHILFSVEVHGRSFVFRPYNLFTFILSEGDYLPFEQANKVMRHENERGLYVFDPFEQKGIFVAKKVEEIPI